MRFLRSRSLSFPSNITGCTDASSTDHLVWHRSIERFYRSWSLQAAFAGVDAYLAMSAGGSAAQAWQTLAGFAKPCIMNSHQLWEFPKVTRIREKTAVDAWHFARPELAEAYLNAFALGLTAARGLFARRRMGKTEFLCKDLLPAAAEKEYLVAYTNLWDTTTPDIAIVSALAQALEPRGLRAVMAAVGTKQRSRC